MLVIAAAACGSGSHKPAKRDAGSGSAAPSEAVVELARAPLGAPRLEAFAWRTRDGHGSYRKAVAAEKTADWPTVVAASRRARDIDPDHLEAAWLEAAALARQGAMEQVLAPLQIAATGDWGKWGERSIELALFAGFRDTPAGRAWTRAADDYRVEYAAALRRSAIVLAGGDLHAYDPQNQRWLRVTRTYGAVRAAVAADAAQLVAYVAVRGSAAGGGAVVSLGVVDLATGTQAREITLARDKLTLRFRDVRGAPALELSDGKRGKWDRIDWTRGTRAPSDARGAVLSPTLVVTGDTARLVRPPSAEVTADWDDHAAAGAMRIERSRRTVTAPGTTLFDGNTLVWSRDRDRLAVVTTPADPCAAEDREVAVVDVDTGRLRSIDRGPAPAQLGWLAGGELAVARAGRVILYAPDGATLATLASVAPLSLWTKPARPACSGAPDPEPPPIEPVPEPEPEMGSDPVSADAAP